MGLVAKKPQTVHRQQTGGQVENPRPEYATGTVHHDAVLEDGTVVHHRQVFDRGLLVEWERTEEPGPWALVRPGDPFQPFAGEDGPGVGDVQVRLGDELLPLPAADDLAAEGWDELPYVPDATARLRFELTASPVGLQRIDVRYQDGRRASAELVEEWAGTREGEPAHDAPELSVTMSWRNYLRMRAGELDPLEAIEDGGVVDARWTLLLLLHGLLQQPRYVEIYRSLPVMPAELGWWGEVAPFVPERRSF
ncbi:MAG TPA: hypothetical protein VKZ55_10545 [Microthrixaceae bacterium]|nr:hypothetical protein [Microthrixaceae bacterium]